MGPRPRKTPRKTTHLSSGALCTLGDVAREFNMSEQGAGMMERRIFAKLRRGLEARGITVEDLRYDRDLRVLFLALK